MATTTVATSIELETVPAAGGNGGSAAASMVQRDPPRSLRAAESSDAPDPVLEASRLADTTVPDGGYGWAVVAGCAIVTWWFVGTSYSWGVMQASLVERGLASPSTLAFIGSLSPAIMAALAIVNGGATRRLGARKSALLGVSLLGSAELLGSFTISNLAGLFVTLGVLLGFGMSFCFMVVTVTPSQYFSRKRGLANGIVFAGGGFGGAAMSFGLDALVQRFGPAWSYRVLGLATLVTGLPAAWLIKERVPIRGGNFVEWRLFKDTGFVLVFLIGAIGIFPLFVPPFFLPLYARAAGLSAATGAGLVAGFNLSSAVGRIACGLLCDRVGALNTLFMSFALSALSMLVLWPVSTSLAPLAVFAVVNGAANGGFFSTMPTVVGNVFGSARVSVAMGMIVTGWGAGYLMGAPIAGYLLEAYGGANDGLKAYRPAMFYAGSLALGSAGLVALVKFRITRRPLARI